MFGFSAETRAAALERIAGSVLDVLVIGGGATGCGVAVDAATRGLSVGLIEREDFGSGTSGRSSRLIHGGLRYLEHGHLGVVYESLHERERLRRLAPHLVRPLPFFVTAPRRLHRLQLRTGLVLYEALAAGRNIARHRAVDAREAARLAPAMASPTRGLVYWDCRTDDARLTLEVARTAARAGAAVANHARAAWIEGGAAEIRVGLRGGSGEELGVARARAVVNAGGVWAEALQGLAVRAPVPLRPSKGVHLVFRASDLPVRASVTVPSVARDGRFVFLVPWGARVYAGTTDTPYRGSLEDPPVDDADAGYLLDTINRRFGASLGPSDVTASWAGLRPLLARGDRSTVDLSRRHVIVESPRGLFTVTGGKLTTYRQMAEDVVDRVCRRLEVRARSRTAAIPLGLTVPFDAALDAAVSEAARQGLGPEVGRRLVELYGDDWDEALRRMRDEPSLGERVVPDLPVLRVEAELARDREMALTEDDVLVRRTRLATMDAAAAAPAQT